MEKPTNSTPTPLNSHCRSIEHIAALKNVDEAELHRAVRKLPKKEVSK